MTDVCEGPSDSLSGCYGHLLESLNYLRSRLVGGTSTGLDQRHCDDLVPTVVRCVAFAERLRAKTDARPPDDEFAKALFIQMLDQSELPHEACLDEHLEWLADIARRAVAIFDRGATR